MSRQQLISATQQRGGYLSVLAQDRKEFVLPPTKLLQGHVEDIASEPFVFAFVSGSRGALLLSVAT